MTRRQVLARVGRAIVAGGTAACSRQRGQKRQPQVVNSKLRKPPDHPAVVFVDVTRQAGIDFIHSSGTRTHQMPEDVGSGAAWGDYDNDGWPDLYLVNQPGPWGVSPSPNTPTSRLYHNNGDGTFTDVTEQAGVANAGGFGMGAAWGDYDNDSYLDLYVTNFGRSVLYHNNGNGTFTDVTERAGVANHRWGMTPVWVDYNNDGWLDLYVPNYVNYNLRSVPKGAASERGGLNVPFTLNPASFDPVPNRLFHNNCDGTFTDVSHLAGVANAEGRSLSAGFADFDLDGWPDLYVTNDISSNRFYRNLEHGRFKDISAASWTEDNRSTMAVAIGDFDGDLDNDMFVTHWATQGDALYQNLWMEEQRHGQIHFSDVADSYGCGEIAMPVAGWGTFFFDLDNDGKLDLMVVNGSTLEDEAETTRLLPERPFLFWSKGDSGFFDLAASGAAGNALQQPIVGRGAAHADFDGDGDLDMLITVNHGRPLLLRNDGGNRKRWLSVHLVGTRSNRGGIGAKLYLKVAGKTSYREYGIQGSYLSQSAPEAWFGLGDQDEAESLTVHWPSGMRQVFKSIPANRTLIITESIDRWQERLPREASSNSTRRPK